MSDAAPQFVRVALESMTDRLFDYAVPPALRGKISIGHRLRVPWRSGEAFAYALFFPDKPAVTTCRDVAEIIGEEPLIPPSLCQLAEWLADYYCCDPALVWRGMLPEAVRDGSHKTRLWATIPPNLEESFAERTLARAKAQLEAWRFARKKGGGWLDDLSRESGCSAAIWRALAKRGLILLQKEKVERNPFLETAAPSKPLNLNPAQRAAFDAITASLATPESRVFLLQGVTGSGKTEIYLQALAEALKSGRSALVLSPEIALTSQTVEHFRARFENMGARVAVLHSRLSDGERHDQWHQIRKGEARIIIGARSAIFAPAQNLGLIIVDEEHEASYKQEETPHYNARDAAVMRGRIEKAVVLLGSATPSLESVHNARQGKYTLLKLAERVDGRELPLIRIVDLRKEKPDGKTPVILSKPLREAVAQRLQRKEQIILFLNRRGFATTTQCPSCGYVEECPQCAVSLTYHRTDRRLRCHLCNYARGVPQKCPQCGFEHYHYTGMGTQKIEDAAQAAFPDARWQRMDSDSMRGKFCYEKTLAAFREGKIDLLVGTQMIAKGLHFPNVTCVGVIHTDAALNLPDFRASERVFQQLVQVAGRAGRGEVAGEVFIQTYTPFHSAIQFARHHDVEGFQDQELEFRQAHDFPPFTRTALITFRGKSEARTRYCAEELAKKIAPQLPPSTTFSEPAPAPIARIKGCHRFHIFLKTRRILDLSRLLKKEVVNFSWPSGVKASVNIDPIHLL
ncbi:MAG: primosomal protein N' [bacterium]